MVEAPAEGVLLEAGGRANGSYLDRFDLKVLEQAAGQSSLSAKELAAAEEKVKDTKAG